MKYGIITAIFLLIFGIADGIKDTTNFHPTNFDKYNLSQEYWNNSVICDGSDTKPRSWTNKYAKDQDGNLIPYSKKWYYFGKKVAYEEKFIFSSTLFVFVTDGFHLMKFIQLLALGLALVFLFYIHNEVCKNLTIGKTKRKQRNFFK